MSIESEIAAQVELWMTSLRDPRYDPYLAQWPHSAPRRDSVAASLPVLRWVANLPSGAPALTEDLVSTICAAAYKLNWSQTYTAAERDTRFFDNYGWSEIFGAQAALRSQRIACGFLLLGPATLYPRHRHEATEVYVPLSGTAAWQQGDEVWRDRLPGHPIFHASGEPHAMRTGAQPLLALYLWRSANLAQKAQLD